MNHAFVVDATRRPLSMCHPARARALLRDKKAAVLRRYPFTIILLEEMPEAVVKPMTVRIDPGAKESGLVLVDADNRVLFAAELTHRGNAIRDAMTDRRQLRRGRRARNTRHRQARFDHRTRPSGWLPPSLQHRVATTMTWIYRFQQFAWVEAIGLERVKFDMQLMQNAEISGIEYQQGELHGYQVREYLLEKFGRRCCYCEKHDVPLQVEHVRAKANGGSNRVSNLALACEPCNVAKGTLRIEDFLAGKPVALAMIKAQLKKPLASAAAVNATRNALLAALCATGLPVESGSGAQTKFNRSRLGYPKAHWIDAACVGDGGATTVLNPNAKPLLIKATGHGNRQMCGTNKYGFPVRHRSRQKSHFGFATGDQVRASIPSGKKVGEYVGRVLCRATGSFDIQTTQGRIAGLSHRHFSIIQRKDGYAYS